MKDINNNEIVHPAFLVLNTGDKVFTVSGKKGISFFSEKLAKIVRLDDNSIKEYNIAILDKVSIKKNEELYYEFQAISKTVSSLGSIVQSDIQAEKSLINEYDTILDECIESLKHIKIKVKNHITK